jgi:predicted ATPase/DNA-binding CsgD family transcriptional regulator
MPRYAASTGAQTQKLTVPSTSLVGRERELAALRRWILDDGTRLLTLTGPPGVGKTRLATEVAANIAERFPEGVAFVDLAPIADTTLVAPTIAKAVGVEDVLERPLAGSLVAALAGTHALILLDNFEHVADAAPLVAEVVRSCPTTTLLVTSRVTLRLSEERIFRVEPLADAAAVRLFVDRARGASPDFSLTHDNETAVTDVCRRVDGLPLAIELAAARANVLSPRMMLERWEHGFALATSGARDLPPRQRTLRAAFDWSYDQLSADEQALFRRLSVFVGGFTLDAVEATCGGASDALTRLEGEPLELLSSLVDKSVVRAAQHADDRRFSLLVPVREYARERLTATGELGHASGLHAQFFVSLAQAGEASREGPAEAAWFARLESEHDNVRAALTWLLERGESRVALQLCGSLGRFWLSRHPREGRRWFNAALARDDLAAPSGARSQGLGFAAVFAFRRGEFASARALGEESLAQARETDDPLAVARALQTLATVTSPDRDAPTDRLLRDSLELFTQAGDQAGRAAILNALGEEARQRGELENAAAAYRESLTLARGVGDGTGIGAALHNLGQIALEQADIDAARALFAEATQVCRDLGDRNLMVSVVAAYGEVAAATGQASRAATLLGATDRQTEIVGVDLQPIDREPFDRSIERARSELGEARFSALWEEGRSLTLDEALSLAERVRPRRQNGGANATNELTPREVDVVRLVAEGSSNAEIAAALFVSEHTVHRHLANVRRKLGVSSRAAVAAYAAQRDLL